MTLDELPAEWRELAATLRGYGAHTQADAIVRCADDLEAALQGRGDERLTLTAAAKVSGYTADHLGRLVREGKLPNVGRPHAPRLRRRDIPIKPGTATPTGQEVGQIRPRPAPSPSARALAMATRAITGRKRSA